MDTATPTLQGLFESSLLPIVNLALVIVFGLISVRLVLRILKYMLLHTSMDKLMIKFILMVAKILLFVGLLLHCLSIIGVPLSGAVAALSAVTLAIGLAIQDIIAGVASGMMLVAIHPFKVGDFVEAGGKSGSVREVNLFHTVLDTPDNKRMMIPNKSIFAGEITNVSYNDTRRIDMIFTADYDDDRNHVMKVIKEVAVNHPLVLKTPEPMVRISETKDSDIAYLCRVWTKNSDYWTVKFDVQEQVLDAYDKYGISMPYPQVTLSYREPKEAKNEQ